MPSKAAPLIEEVLMRPIDESMASALTDAPCELQSADVEASNTSESVGPLISPQMLDIDTISRPGDAHRAAIFAYFDFIESEPLSRIEPEDFKFLEDKGCFHMPQKPLLYDIISEYFLHVHPVLPVIDERRFWQAYLSNENQSGNKKVPLFVFCAMLFVGCSVSKYFANHYFSQSNMCI